MGFRCVCRCRPWLRSLLCLEQSFLLLLLPCSFFLLPLLEGLCFALLSQSFFLFFFAPGFFLLLLLTCRLFFSPPLLFLPFPSQSFLSLYQLFWCSVHR